MNRVFGKKEASASFPPSPSLSDASTGMDGRIQAMDVKINTLDKELLLYRDKMKKCRDPNTKRNLQKCAMDVIKRNKMLYGQLDQLANQQINVH